MKLVTAALAVSLALVGCASDNDGEGGGFVAGLRPAKPSLDDSKGPTVGINPAIQFILNGGLAMDIEKGSSILTPDGGDVSAEHINVPFPIENLCTHCDDVLVLRDQRDPGELNVLDHTGHFFCRIWVEEDGHIVSSDCR